ncbi:hypothetical protein BRD00_03575 [Halobacteriales archaeon QS_8_69_26]|nr:MAG: hypothetical protein BRD00_03575 [Halobacteriales archaeon QS_8_69_26]
MTRDAIPGRVATDLRSLPSGVVDLRAMGMGPTGVAAVCLVDPGTVRVEHAVGEIERVFSPDLEEMDPATTVTEDRLDQPWIVFETTPERFEELVASLVFAVDSLFDRGYGDYPFVAAVELHSPHEGRLYLFYRFDERGFYPFAPRPEGRRRHSGLERKVADAIREELTLLADEDDWTPVWGPDGSVHPWNES